MTSVSKKSQGNTADILRGPALEIKRGPRERQSQLRLSRNPRTVSYPGGAWCFGCLGACVPHAARFTPTGLVSVQARSWLPGSQTSETSLSSFSYNCGLLSLKMRRFSTDVRREELILPVRETPSRLYASFSVISKSID